MTGRVDAHAHSASQPAGREAEALLAAMDAAGVGRTLLVPPAAAPDGNTVAVAWARAHPGRFAVVAGVRLGDPEPVIRSLLADPAVVGLRLAVHEAGPDWVDHPTVNVVCRALKQMGGSLTLYAPRGAARVRSLARRHPAIALLIDNLALPFEFPPDAFAEWDDVVALGAVESVYLKLSCLPAIDALDYPHPSAVECVRVLADAMGPERLMWGSNWPHIGAAAAYLASAQLVAVTVSELSAAEQSAVLGGTAERVLLGQVSSASTLSRPHGPQSGAIDIGKWRSRRCVRGSGQ